MAYPVAVVEIGFGASDTPYTLNPTWVDVSNDVLEMSVDRGRSDDWGTFSGSASVTLNNNSRKYDPFNSASPYNGLLTPRRQIRIKATYGGSTYEVFRGFVDGFSPDWQNAGKSSTVTLSCFDALQLLASNSLPADWSKGYILGTAPRHYYPCDEPITPYTTGTLKDYGSYPQNMTVTTIATNGSQLAAGLVNSSIQGTGGVAAATDYGVITGSTSFTVSMWAILDPDVGYTYGEIGDCSWSVGYTGASSQFNIFIVDGSAGVYRLYTTSTTLEGSSPRLISFSFNVVSKAFAFYLDGVALATSVISGAQLYIPVGEQTNIGGGQIQQLVIWSSVVSQAVIQEIFKYSTVTLPETTSARVARLIAQTPFSSSLVSTPAAPAANVLEITDDAPAVATELQKVADSEYAPLFVDKAGVLTLYAQNQIRSQTRSIVSQASYGGAGLPIGQEVSITLDGDSMRNTANVSMSQGGVYVKENTTSLNAYGKAEVTVDTQVSNLANAEAIANIATGWGGNVYPKVSPVEVVLSGDNSWGSTLGLELNDRITLTVSPPVGSPITNYLLVQRITHSVVAGQWSTTLEGSARWAAVFIIGTSLIGGTDLLG